MVVDLRKESKTFGKWAGINLSAENFNQLWIPKGFAHGFLTLSNFAEINYKTHFNALIKKQTNHLIYEINRSKKLDDKIVGSTAIILVGLTYGDSYYLKFGIDLLKQLLKFSLDESYFPKSRNIRQLVFYLKYLIVIRELLKESQTNIPDFLNEIVFYLGKSYNLLCANKNVGILFNGNFGDSNSEFDSYLNLMNL